MDGLTIVILILFALVAAPLFAIFGAAAMILFSEEGTITSVAVDVFSERFADSPTLVTLPLFTFAGYLMAEAGTPKRLVAVSRALFGWMPGGLAVVCLLASAFFTTFTGGSGITIVAVGGLLFPAMIAERYQEKFSLGLVTTGGSLGLLFPPSIPIILYAVVAGILIDKLFLAGIIPGIITVAILSVYAVVFGGLRRGRRAQKEESGGSIAQFASFSGVLLLAAAVLGGGVAMLSNAVAGGYATLFTAGLLGFAVQAVILVLSFLGATYTTRGETRKALLEGSWEILLPFVLIAGLATGVLRIHEAAALTAGYVLIIEVFVYRDISIARDLPRVIKDSMTMLGAILAILATALGFTGYLIQANVPEQLVELMEAFIDAPFIVWLKSTLHISDATIFLLLMNLFLLVVGMLMDIFSAIVVVVPLIVPIAAHFGINPYHLGIMFLLNLEIGYLTPPVGLNLFISSFRFEKPVTQLYRAVLPFIGLLIIALAITTYIPVLSTWLPSFISTEELTVEDIEQEGDVPLPDDGDTGGETLDDLGGGETLDDLEGGGGETLDDLEGGGETLDDLEPPNPPREGETLDDL